MSIWQSTWERFMIYRNCVWKSNNVCCARDTRRARMCVWACMKLSHSTHGALWAAWLEPIGQPVITGSDSPLNLCEHTLLFSATLGPWAERAATGRVPSSAVHFEQTWEGKTDEPSSLTEHLKRSYVNNPGPLIDPAFLNPNSWRTLLDWNFKNRTWRLEC